MKSKAAFFWFVVSLALAGAFAVQWVRGGKQQSKLEAIQLEVEKLSQQSRTAATEVQELQKERTQLRGELVATQGELNRARAPQAQPPPGSSSRDNSRQAGTQPGGGKASGGMAGFVGNMMKDPEMRKAMEQQQRMGFNLAYGNLFKDLQLTADQEQKLKDLLVEQGMANMSQATELTDAGANKGEVLKRLAEDQTQRQEKIKNLLGEEKYGQFQEYNETLGERILLDQLGKDIEMNPDQREQLLAIVKEEKKNVQINTGLANSEVQAAFSSPEIMERLFGQQEQVNARVLERASEILTPEQVRKLEPVFKAQMEMQKAGMKMSREMFGGANSSPEGPK